MNVTTIVFLATSLGVNQYHGTQQATTTSAAQIEHTAYRQLGQGWTTGSSSAEPGRYDNYNTAGAGASAQTAPTAGRTAVDPAGNDTQSSRLIDRSRYAQSTESQQGVGASQSVVPPQLAIPPSSDPYRGTAGPVNWQQNSRNYEVADPGRNPFPDRNSGNSGPVLTDYRNQSDSAQRGMGGVLVDGTRYTTSDQSSSGMVPVETVRGGYADNPRDSRSSDASADIPPHGNQAGDNRDPRYGNDYSPIRGDREPRSGDLGAWTGGSIQVDGRPSQQAGIHRGPDAGIHGNPNTNGLRQPAQTNVGYPPVDSSQTGTHGQLPPNVGGYYPSAGEASNEDAVSGPSETPWVPLVMTGVMLMGSLGANLFLGFSYLDARHKYLTAIRRGSRSIARSEAAT